MNGGASSTASNLVDEDEETRVLFLGRALPRASGAERIAWSAVLVGLLLVLGIATRLSPDPRGVGTHEQLRALGLPPLPPCGFLAATGWPCPSCGYTTTFALAAHGRWIAAFVNQPMGFLVFLGFCAGVPISLGAVVRGFSPAKASDAWPWRTIFVVFLALWIAGWVYKAGVLHA